MYGCTTITRVVFETLKWVKLNAMSYFYHELRINRISVLVKANLIIVECTLQKYQGYPRNWYICALHTCHNCSVYFNVRNKLHALAFVQSCTKSVTRSTLFLSIVHSMSERPYGSGGWSQATCVHNCTLLARGTRKLASIALVYFSCNTYHCISFAL